MTQENKKRLGWSSILTNQTNKPIPFYSVVYNSKYIYIIMKAFFTAILGTCTRFLANSLTF